MKFVFLFCSILRNEVVSECEFSRGECKIERPLWLRGCEFLRQRALLRASDFCRNCSRFGGAKASTCRGFEAVMANSPPLFSGKKLEEWKQFFTAEEREEKTNNILITFIDAFRE